MSDYLTQTHRSRVQGDEGDIPRTKSSARYEPSKVQTEPITRRPVNVPSRASRPAPKTTPVYPYADDEIKTQDYRRRRRSRTTDSYDPRQARQETHYPEFDRSRSRSYVYASQDEEEQPQYTRYNRRQRRSLTKTEIVLCRWAIMVLTAAIILYVLGSLAHAWYIEQINDPATYGPEHGNIVHLIEDHQDYYVQGINDEGNIEMIVVPEGHPGQTRIYAGVSGAADNVEVELQAKDVNGDSHPDIVEHLLFDPSTLFFPRSSSKPYTYLNDGKGQFKLQMPDQEVTTNGK